MSDPYIPDAPPPRGSTAQRRVLLGVAAALGAVILAPIALSMQHLVDWAADPHGLGLGGAWPLAVPVALDLAAAACIGMTVVSAWRRERPGAFGLLVWVFAAVSAYAQYTYGTAERAAGRAQDAWWAMPMFALLGPLLLELVLHRVRQWARRDAGEILSGAAGFGIRWLVSPWNTLSAWAASRREGIASAQAALAFVRERKTLRSMLAEDALAWAFGALGMVDPHAARLWLSARGVRVTQVDIDRAVAGRIVAPVSSPPALGGWPLPSGESFDDYLAATLAAAPTMRARMRIAASAIANSARVLSGPAIVAWLAERDYPGADRSEAAKVAREMVAAITGQAVSV